MRPVSRLSLLLAAASISVLPLGATRQGSGPQGAQRAGGPVHLGELSAEASLAFCLNPCIRGTVYLDADADATKDATEPGLGLWTVELRDATNSVVDVDTTDAEGRYYFGVGPGAWKVIAYAPADGWVRTAPATVYHTVEVPDSVTFFTATRNFGFVNPCETPMGVRWIAGDVDNFDYEGASDATNVPPGSTLETRLLACNASNPYFDAPQFNTCWGHAFENVVPVGCHCVSARLWITIDPTGCCPSTDSLAFLQDGLTVWSKRLYDLEPTGGPFHSGSSTTLILDLGSLPASSAGVTSVLPTLNDGMFEVFLQDDTRVDSMALEVAWCCPCP